MLHKSKSDKHVDTNTGKTTKLRSISSSTPVQSSKPSYSTDSSDSSLSSHSNSSAESSPALQASASHSSFFDFKAFRRHVTAKEVMTRTSTMRPALMRQKSYFLEEHVTFRDSSLKASDLTSLEKILNDKVGIATFRNFLKSVFAEENLGFWSDVVAFKKTTPDQRDFEAKRIYVLYIHDKATYPLNVAQTTKATIVQKIERTDTPVEPNIFDEAQDQAYDMMERDCFPRFRKSPYFYKLQEGLDEVLISHMVKKKTGDRKSVV